MQQNNICCCVGLNVALLVVGHQDITTMSIQEQVIGLKYNVGQFVKDIIKPSRRGKIVGFISPVGTAGEWTYDVLWFDVGSGSGWRDCDLTPAL